MGLTILMTEADLNRRDDAVVKASALQSEGLVWFHMTRLTKDFYRVSTDLQVALSSKDNVGNEIKKFSAS